MDSVEAEGDSIDAAISAALKMLDVTRDRVEIEILSSAARGLFGIGGRKARVRASMRAPFSAEFAATTATIRTEPSAPQAANEPAEAGTGRAADRACQVLEQITTRLGVLAGISVHPAADHIVLELTGDSSGILIGRRGQMLDAMEYIVNRIVGRNEEDAARIVIDSQNYRARRREALEDLARRMADQAKKKGKAVTLNPMSPRDRRIVHLLLQEDPSLTTKSSGKGYFRKLIIIPATARRIARSDD